MGYTYDANSNLHQRTDARGVTTTYQYDNLNRVIRTDYSDGTPYTLFTYDFAANGRGRFHADYESSTQGTINYVLAYDAAGRPTSGQACFYLLGTGWLPCYVYSRSYDRAGNVTSQTYPSGRTVSYNYDAAGRLADYNGSAAFSGNLGDDVSRAYSAGVSYDEAGRMQEERFGTQTPLYHKLHYNVRGQLYDVRLSTVAWQPDGAGQWDWNRGAVALYYGGAGHGQSSASNNGNVTMAQHWVPADDQITAYSYTQQSYAYDPLNRLSSVTEQAGTQAGLAGAHGAQHYGYDRWGNRTINAADTWGAGIPEPQFELSPQTNQEVAEPSNRLYAPGDANRAPSQKLMRYDAAGNLVHDGHTGAGGRTYDAENRMTSAWGPALSGGSYLNRYVYDAAGKRVRRQAESGEAWHVYGFDGELLAEYAAAGAPSQPRKEYGYRGGELLIVAEAGAATPGGGNPYGGAAAAVPGTVEVERYDEGGQGAGYYDTTPGSHGQDYDQAGYPVPSFRQPTDVDLYKSAGYSGGYLIVGQAGDWLNYTVDVATAGTYTLAARVAWGNAVGGTFRVEVDGVDKTGPIQIPDTGWSLQTITKAGVQLPAGRHVLRVVWETNAANGYTGDIDHLNFTLEAASGGGAGLRWIVTDHLGTPRMTADQTGSLAGIRRHDYLPFGEEVGDGVGGRTQGQGYSADNVRQKFTGYERDSETALDYAQARYYSSGQGRFTSVDPLLASGSVMSPQSWNRYSYTMNNPTRYIDPSGMIATSADQQEQVKTVRAVAAGEISILGNTVKIYVAVGHSQEQLKMIAANLRNTAKVINDNAGKLSDEDKAIIGNVKQIVALGPDIKSGDRFNIEGVGGIDPKALSNEGVDLPTGTFLKTGLGLINSSAATELQNYMASEIAHEGFHVQDFKTRQGEFSPEAQSWTPLERNNVTERRGLTYQLGIYRKFSGSTEARPDRWDKWLQQTIKKPHARPGIK